MNLIKSPSIAYCRTNTKKLPSTLAESALIGTEESIMATFDFLSGENVIDEENLSDGENEDDITDDQLLVKKAKIKVCSPDM